MGVVFSRLHTSRPTVTITSTFSEAATGFAAADISVTGGSAAKLQTSDNRVYRAEVTPSAQGSVTVNVAAGVCQDSDGNLNQAAPTPITRTYDSVRPTVTITSPASEPTPVSPFPIRIVFSEPVTGFALADLAVSGGTAGSFTGSSRNYTADVTPAGQGSVSILITADVCYDACGNLNDASSPLVKVDDPS